MLTSPFLLVTGGALLVEAACGYPDWLLRRIGHPVMWAGAAIAWLDRTLNRGTHRRLRGVAALVAVVATSGVAAWAVQAAVLCLLPTPWAVVLLAVLASSLLAQRSLWQHVAAVAAGLEQGLAPGRTAVAHIVGRDPESLDAAGVARAAIESLAENFADGVVAPALWCGLFGLPGLVVYKVVNTADSMIGHRTPQYEAFGWAAARLDDAMNLPASRLACALLAVAAGRAMPGAARAAWRDARHHRSPNAGWPEAAMAGALALRLAGPRVYGAVRVADGWIGDGRAEAGPDDIRRGLVLYRRACAVGWLALAASAGSAMVLP